MSDCIFCKLVLDKKGYAAETATLFAVFDLHPVSKGHAMIIPKRHIESNFDLNEQESKETTEILKKLKAIIDQKYSPKGYNIGSNNGKAAGQFVMHFHIHVIPRYKEGPGLHALGEYEK